MPNVVVVVGEVLWDIFPKATLLGGAPLNFAVHAKRMHLHPIFISALGTDILGQRAAQCIKSLGLDMSMLRWSTRWDTGTATVSIGENGQPAFRIARPAAYDDVTLTRDDLQALARLDPSWFYYGTLFASTREGRATLQQLLDALPAATRFYDVNLRPGFDSLDLVEELLPIANVVKMNETEADVVSSRLGLPSNLETFCRSGVERFGWRAVCVTLGEKGCVMFDGQEFVEASSEKVVVADTVGSGDAFAAAFVHGLTSGWPVSKIAKFANRIGGLIASRAGGTPEWSIGEAVIG